MKAADSWSELQAAARELEQRREQEGLEYGDPSALEVKQLVSYVFRARKSKGVSEHQAPKAKAVDFLDALPAGEMQQLLLCEEPGVVGALLLGAPVTTTTTAPQQGPLALTHTGA